MKKIITGTLAGTLGIIGVTAAAYMPYVISQAGKKYRDSCDCLLILGSDVEGAETPSPQFAERISEAAKYLSEHKDTFVIPCGGCFRKEQKKSEAQITAERLIAAGIDPGRIALEDKSTTTFENFEFARPLIEKNCGSDAKVAYLTSSYHIGRSGLIAKMCGYKDLGRVTAKTPGKAFPRFVREYFVAWQLLTELIKRKAGGKK